MSSHDPGHVYADWRKMEAGITQLEQEIRDEQVRHIDLAEYAEGTERYLRLITCMKGAV